jgi:hypothetical protein
MKPLLSRVSLVLHSLIYILFTISKLLDKFVLGPKYFISDFVEALEIKRKNDIYSSSNLSRDKNNIKTK